ncbi:LytR/AlgR family response regulator transcription factor [Flavobacterium caeni]|uniref:Two component transcriptional regulator, LytTR family n=1 Tax=Flavobacterium caeni TaxID=490189 RepID=A0A1G5GAF2_9FLAO|nr:LytTR family DNA-binding domain-containing protein [Flavobacterium caeni]SCY48596.1 two component transcriptional regulator, LytTR family [Flavobacterium caeni]
MKWDCIIVDDTEIDNLTVVSYVKRFPFFNLIGAYQSSREALSAIEKNKVDVIFLDIDMPNYNGIEVRKRALDIPACVFITSHTEYAIEGFELDALDYIVKPLTFDRFTKTVKRIEDFMDLRNKAELFEASIGGDAIFIKEGHSETKVKLTDVLYLEALKNYTLIATPEKKHRVLLNIGMLLKDDNFRSFVRVHRGFAVQKHFIKKISAQEIELADRIAIPIGRNYKDNLSQLLS